MKNKLFVVFSMAVVFLTASGRMYAHHSELVNDQTRLISVTGAVTDFRFTNPHVQIYMDVKDAKGTPEQWIATVGAPATMRRVGWNKETLKPGDMLTVVGFPYRDGSHIVFQLRATRANGDALPQGEGESGRLERFLATHPGYKLEQPAK